MNSVNISVPRLQVEALLACFRMSDEIFALCHGAGKASQLRKRYRSNAQQN